MRPTGDLMAEHRVIEKILKVVSKAADKLEDNEPVDPKVFVDASDFLRNFADRCHHGKEEKLLFVKMMERGVSGEVGPIAVMMREHQDGRVHVKKITELSGKRMTKAEIQEMIKNIRGYVNLLSQHIMKEDNVLYPMANEILTAEDQEELMKGFEKVETEVMGPGVHEKYHHMIEEWERKFG